MQNGFWIVCVLKLIHWKWFQMHRVLFEENGWKRMKKSDCVRECEIKREKEPEPEW